MNLSIMPFDVVNNLLSYMPYQDHVTLQSVCSWKECPNWKQIIDKEAPKKIFTKKYGAVCSFETTLSETVRKIKILEKPNCLSFFDNQGNVIEPSQQESPSFFESLKIKYELFSASKIKGALGSIDAITAVQRKIAEELAQKITSDNPLQDLCDRLKRLTMIERQQNNITTSFKEIKSDYNKFVNELDFSQKCMFSATSLYNKDFSFQTVYRLPIEEMSLPIRAESLAERGIMHSELEIFVQGKPVAVKVVSSFPLWPRDKTLFFSIIRKDNGQDLGYIKYIMKLGSELYINIFEDRVGQDPETGDFPVKRLLLQMAIEIFNRENCTKLQALANGVDSFIFAAGGLFTWDGKSAMEAITPCRQKTRKLYPTVGNLGSTTHYVWKLPDPYSSSVPTHFAAGIAKDGGPILVPALVDFELDSPPITWEEQIAKQPLLGKGKSPILPIELYIN